MEYSDGVQKYIKKGQEMSAQTARQRSIMRKKKFDTIAVHGIYNMQEALNNNGSLIEPAYLSTAQHYENSDHLEAGMAYLMPAWTYSRIANPTTGYLEEVLALLDGYGFDGEVSACATSSGMAAIFMATNPLLAIKKDNPNQPINFVSTAKCYGGTFMLFHQRYGIERGYEVRWVKDELDLEEWKSKIDENTRFVFGEMPSNPGLGIFDIAKVAEMAHGFDIPLIVDATIATPALLRPLNHGADVVVHSLTKAATTSGFAVGGALIAKHNMPSPVGPDELKENFATYVKLLPYRDYGPAISPFNALMTLSNLRTVRHKADMMSRNAMKVARFLEQEPKIEWVSYPGLKSSAGHEVASRYMWLADGEDDYGESVNRYGHLMGFTVKGGPLAARKMFDNFQMIWRATDLGRIKTVATIPAISTHQQQGEEGRELASVPSNLIRLSPGGEHPDDIIADLEQALANI